jgi:competence protein ComEC
VVAPSRRRHSVSSTYATTLVACMWLFTWRGESWQWAARFRWGALVLLVVVLIARAPRWVTLIVVCVVGSAGGAAAWQAPVVHDVSQCSGAATLMSDPTPVGTGVRLTLEIGGQRHVAVAFGSPARLLAHRLAREKVFVDGMCSPLNPEFARFELTRHVVGRMAVTSVSERFVEPSPLVRSANRVRDAMSRGVSRMNPTTRSLFTGLVVGDDRLQPKEMVDRFRGSGLSHLCAASGQNVAYLLALAGPFLRRRSPRTKLLATLVIISWFVVLTRAEPSVLRAGFMAAAVAVNAARRRPENARAVLALSAMCLLVIDPMLAWSVGFAMSVGATAGLAWLSAPLGTIIGHRGALASTLAAQLGTMPVSLCVFGHVPVVSLVANPLALPVAGVVMTIGLPMSLLAAAIPPSVPLVSALLSLPVVWVDVVARVFSGMSVTGAWNWIMWAVVALWVLHRWRQHAPRRTRVAG